MPEKTTTNFALPYPTGVGKVNLGAKDFEELAKSVDKVFTEKALRYKGYSGPGTLTAGEFAFQEKNGETFTLPAVGTANQVIGIYSIVNEAKVTTSGGAKIYGDFISAAGTITLTLLQHVVLQSTGVNWFIIAGEPKREQTYSALKAWSKAEAEAGVEPSASRDAMVDFAASAVNGLEIGGVKVGAVGGSKRVPAGQKWKATVAVETSVLLL